MKLRVGFVSNSSSASFICDVTMSAEEVETKLRKILEGYNQMMEENHVFENVFRAPYVAGKIVHEGWEDSYPEFNDCEGKIIIDSADDNSIPYPLFDIIESKFNAVHCHLG